MKKNRHSNIFDTAGKKPDKKKKKKKTKSTSAAKRRPQPETQPPKPGAAFRDEEVAEMFKRIRDMEDNLEKKMDNICEVSGMTKKELDNFIDNPDNFPPERWKKVQAEKEALEKKLFSAFGIQTKKKILKKKKKKLAKERCGKTLGSRKGWIQM